MPRYPLGITLASTTEKIVFLSIRKKLLHISISVIETVISAQTIISLFSIIAFLNYIFFQLEGYVPVGSLLSSVSLLKQLVVPVISVSMSIVLLFLNF